MTNDESEQKDLMQAIRNLLRSVEEVKAYISPIVRQQKDAFKVLKSHEEAIARVMEILMGTQKTHKTRIQKLELDTGSIKTRISKIEEKLQDHEKMYLGLRKGLAGSALKIASQIADKIDKRPISQKDVGVVEKLILADPSNVFLWQLKARLLYQMVYPQKVSRFKNKAMKFADEAVSKYPRDPMLWYYRGLIFSDFSEGLKSFEKSMEFLKSSDSLGRHIVTFSKATLLARNKKLKEALDSATVSVEANPQCTQGWLLKGKLLTELDRIPEALGCFEKAIELDKNNVDAWFGKGKALASLGPNTSDEAIETLNMVTKLDKTRIVAYIIKGDLLLEKTKYQDALENYNLALESHKKDACLWCKRATALDSLGQFKAAADSYIKAFEFGPPRKCNTILNNYAYMLYHTGKYEEGAKLARKAVEAEPNNAEYQDTLACNLQALGKDKAALKAFSEALRLKKSDKQITWAALASLYRKLGREKEAKQAIKKGKSLESEKAD
jgi:tetratricopeptide (TPR) repeat protein